jgi:hypothetical protein
LVTASPNDDLSWDERSGVCRSVVTGRDVRWRGGEWGAPRGAGGTTPVPRQCCTFETLIKAEWNHYIRQVAPEAAGGA